MRNLVLLLVLLCSTSAFAENLIGGRPAMKGEYPEILYIRSGNSRCSASLIGSSVILTAGHCVKDQGEIGPTTLLNILFDVNNDVDFVVDQTVYTAKCYQAPLYRDHKEDHDLALCKTDKPVKIKPASISEEGPEIGDMAILTGYGCVKPGAGTGGNDGILRVGKAEVTKLPSGKYHWFDTKGEMALCYGDSGAPALLDTDEGHLVIGVASRGNIQNLSMLTALFTPASVKFMNEFAKKQKVAICGVTKKC